MFLYFYKFMYDTFIILRIVMKEKNAFMFCQWKFIHSEIDHTLHYCAWQTCTQLIYLKIFFVDFVEMFVLINNFWKLISVHYYNRKQNIYYTHIYMYLHILKFCLELKKYIQIPWCILKCKRIYQVTTCVCYIDFVGNFKGFKFLTDTFDIFIFQF